MSPPASDGEHAAYADAEALDVNNVAPAPQKMTEYSPIGERGGHLLGCMSDLPTCALGTLFPCVLFGMNMRKAGVFSKTWIGSLLYCFVMSFVNVLLYTFAVQAQAEKEDEKGEETRFLDRHVFEFCVLIFAVQMGYIFGMARQRIRLTLAGVPDIDGVVALPSNRLVLAKTLALPTCAWTKSTKNARQQQLPGARAAWWLHCFPLTHWLAMMQEARALDRAKEFDAAAARFHELFPTAPKTAMTHSVYVRFANGKINAAEARSLLSLYAARDMFVQGSGPPSLKDFAPKICKVAVLSSFFYGILIYAILVTEAFEGAQDGSGPDEPNDVGSIAINCAKAACAFGLLVAVIHCSIAHFCPQYSIWAWLDTFKRMRQEGILPLLVHPAQEGAVGAVPSCVSGSGDEGSKKAEAEEPALAGNV